ncbi:hypothetical protein EYF80_044431 [Liparis tanakae]|uniref:Uncharacterized protein n=1 Tax=Liparis tanakae TaxID=230148 RepID=A0A4Z2FWS5_9TELE|nr:hypothetical protein EYF80_044431 [Liparis tanakae]
MTGGRPDVRQKTGGEKGALEKPKAWRKGGTNANSSLSEPIHTLLLPGGNCPIIIIIITIIIITRDRLGSRGEAHVTQGGLQCCTRALLTTYIAGLYY